METRALALSFILLWSSAFITSKIIVADATPFAALCFRFALVVVGYAAVACWLGERLRVAWREAVKAMAIGALFHGFYLGGVFYSVAQGMPAGLTALIVTLQPILTALFAQVLLGETVTRRQWVGIVLGFAGAAVVLGVDLSGDLPLGAYAAAVAALLAITAGTLWQKRVSHNLPLVVNNMYQALSAMLFHLIAAASLETVMINFTPSFIAAMGWQIIAVSFGAFTILTYLIKHGSASKTAALFFLVPGISAVMAWVFVDETLSLTGVAGLLLSSLGVYIATRRPRAD